MKKGHVFGLTLVLFGLLDLVTTVVGITFFGATEANPILAGVAMASPLVFSVIKLFAISAIGCMFYKAGSVEGGLTNRYLQVSYSFALVFMTYVVTNNMLVVARIA